MASYQIRVLIIICFILICIYLIMFQITCTPSSHCDFEPGVDPIPVSQEGEVQFSLHLNLLGEPQTVSGPMEPTLSILTLPVIDDEPSFSISNGSFVLPT